jgi:hypothetical protein
VSGSTGRLRQSISTEIGQTYKLTMSRVGGSTSGRLDIGTNAGGNQIEAGIVVDGNVTRTFVATGPTTWLNFYVTSDGSCEINSISVTRA